MNIYGLKKKSKELTLKIKYLKKQDSQFCRNLMSKYWSKKRQIKREIDQLRSLKADKKRQ